MTYEGTCEKCGVAFGSNRRNQRFCTAACRYGHHASSRIDVQVEIRQLQERMERIEAMLLEIQRGKP